MFDANISASSKALEKSTYVFSFCPPLPVFKTAALYAQACSATIKPRELTTTSSMNLSKAIRNIKMQHRHRYLFSSCFFISLTKTEFIRQDSMSGTAPTSRPSFKFCLRLVYEQMTSRISTGHRKGCIRRSITPTAASLVKYKFPPSSFYAPFHTLLYNCTTKRWTWTTQIHLPPSPSLL
jgi:hypothetical protein